MAAGWVAFSSVLQNPYSSLVERTNLCSHMNIRIMISFVQALANNNKLSELLLEAWSYAYISTEVNAAFIRVLCNSSSILNTYSSNHTIGKLCCNIEDRYLPEDIRSLLWINTANTKSQAVRLKIIQAHFGGSSINMQPFTEMDLILLPVSISWMAQDYSCNSRSLLYQFVWTHQRLCKTWIHYNNPPMGQAM